jgi:hypothetical protein
VSPVNTVTDEVSTTDFDFDDEQIVSVPKTCAYDPLTRL